MRMTKTLMDRILRESDLVAIISEWAPVVRSGRCHRGECPLCESENEVLEVHCTEIAFFYCSACRKEGDVLDWMILMHNLTRSEAAAELARRLGLAGVRQAA